jgi:hypothetical protein
MKQREGKITREECAELAKRAKRVDGLCNQIKPLHHLWSNFIDSELFWNSNIFLSKLGGSLVTMSEYESNPGVWIFDDESNGISFLINME